ncbi:MAG: hypothetical protein JW743_02540 [Deltaproteobacteria bacterium]|nr:hypothetical protein [Deltaproteobacteria bacterium]MBN2844543.1 hypothetical protein [Deltaproteobacteria bacterium]
MQALFTLTPAESKRLIAKGVLAMPEVQEAREKGYLIVGRGSTNGYIAEELMGKEMEKEKYVAGQSIRGILCALHQGIRLRPVSFYKGELLEVEPGTLIDKLGPGDIVLKGANAIDSQGNVGVVMASPVGGTMGEFYMATKAQGVDMIYPVGLEKMVLSVEEAAQCGGRLTLERTIGAPVGFACVADGIVITEIDAIDILFGIDAVHFASGGYGGSEGCVSILIEGEDEDVNECMDFIETIKGEPPLPSVKGPCKTCPVLCSFQGKEEEELPVYLR